METLNQQDDGGWRTRAVDATIAGLLAGLAFIEFAPQYFPDIALDRSQYRLFEFHLALNAVLLFGLGAYIRKGGISGSRLQRALPFYLIYTPLWGLTFINGFLAARSIITLDVEKIWIALLALPAIVTFIANPAMLGEVEDEDDLFDDELDYAGDAFNQDVKSAQPTPEAGVEDHATFADKWDRFFSPTYQVAYYGFYLVLIGIALFYYSVLDTSLFSNQIVSLDQLKTEAAAAFKSFIPHLIAIPTVIAMMAIVVWIFLAAYKLYLKIRHPNMDGEPSATDIDYIESAYDQLGAYFENQHYPRIYGFLYYVVPLVLLIITMSIMGNGSAWLASNLPPLIETERTANSVIYIYGNITSLFPAVFGVFSGIMMMGAMLQTADRIAPRYAEYAFASGWNTINNRDRTPDDYLEIITKFVRIGTLRTDQPFEPRAFILLGFKEFEKLIYGITLVVFILTAGPLFFNVQYFHLFAEDRIEYSGYFTTRSYRIAYDDVREVRQSCYAYGDEGKQQVRTAYKVVLDDTHMVDIFDDTWFEQEDLAAFKAVDHRLRIAGVKFTREDLYGWPKKDKTAFGDDCREVLIERYDVETGSAIANLLQADGCYPFFLETNFCTKNSFLTQRGF